MGSETVAKVGRAVGGIAPTHIQVAGDFQTPCNLDLAEIASVIAPPAGCPIELQATFGRSAELKLVGVPPVSTPGYDDIPEYVEVFVQPVEVADDIEFECFPALKIKTDGTELLGQ